MYRLELVVYESVKIRSAIAGNMEYHLYQILSIGLYTNAQSWKASLTTNESKHKQNRLIVSVFENTDYKVCTVIQNLPLEYHMIISQSLLFNPFFCMVSKNVNLVVVSDEIVWIRKLTDAYC